MSNRRLITVIAALIIVVMAVSVGGVGASQLGIGENLIYAAYNKATGDLRIISDGEVRKNEVPISWNAVGPQGPQGEAGPQGPMGPPGPPGDCSSDIQYLQEQITLLQARVLNLERALGIATEIDYVNPVYLNVKYGSSWSEVESLLPSTVEVILEDQTTQSLAVTWDGDITLDGTVVQYDGSVVGTYVIKGTIALIDGIFNTADHNAIVNLKVWSSENAVPVISGVSIAQGTYKIGDTIGVTVTADAPGYTAGAVTINGVDVTNTFIADGTNYYFTYTVAEGDTDRSTVSEIPVSVVLNLNSLGSPCEPYTDTPTSTGSVKIDANLPTFVDAYYSYQENPNEIRLYFNENVTRTGTEPLGIRVYVDGMERIIYSITGVGGHIWTLTLRDEVPYYWSVVTVDYDGNGSITDLVGHKLPSFNQGL